MNFFKNIMHEVDNRNKIKNWGWETAWDQGALVLRRLHPIPCRIVDNEVFPRYNKPKAFSSPCTHDNGEYKQTW